MSTAHAIETLRSVAFRLSNQYRQEAEVLVQEFRSKGYLSQWKQLRVDQLIDEAKARPVASEPQRSQAMTKRCVLVHRLWGVYLGEHQWTLKNDPGMPGCISFGSFAAAMEVANRHIRDGLAPAGFEVIELDVEFPFIGPELLARYGIDEKLLGNMRQNKLDCLRGH